MKLTYDPRYNIAYIQLREKQEPVDSIKISEELVIDISADGTVYGIELLNAKNQLQDPSSPHLLFINKATGEEKQMEIL
ncbi:MAG: DUF2283 domain-containing protein [Bacteroidota bacterium]